MKTLVIFATHCINTSLTFFLKHGYYASTDTDFYICINNPTLDISSLIKPADNLFIVHRENVGLDFGAWSQCLLKNDMYRKYDYFILLNNTCIGPFLPLYVTERWTDLLIRLLNDRDKLIGATINYWHGRPHVQSYCLCTDKIGLMIGIKNAIFTTVPIKLSKSDIIERFEIGFSKAILDAGFNINCLMRGLAGIDFRTHRHHKQLSLPYGDAYTDMAFNNSYFGININPYEVMFFKANRNVTPNILSKYLAFYERDQL